MVLQPTTIIEQLQVKANEYVIPSFSEWKADVRSASFAKGGPI